MKVLLASVGNPDYGQNPNEPLWSAEPDHWMPVESTEQASRECVAFIGRNDLGGGNWAGGEVQDDEGKVMGRVSYNGRFWPSQTFPGGRWTSNPVAA